MQRRAFVKSGALALVTLGLSPSFLRRTAFGARAAAGAEGQNADLPVSARCGGRTQHGRASRRARRTTRCGRPSPYRVRRDRAHNHPATRRSISMDFSGFTRRSRRSSRCTTAGLLAPVHAVGSPSATRSHFDAQDYMETGTPDVKGTPDGWLNRYLAVEGTCDECDASPFRAVSLTPADTANHGRRERGRRDEQPRTSSRCGHRGSQAERLEALYRTGSADLVHGTGAEMFEAVKMLRAANPQKYAAAKRRGISALTVRAAPASDRAAHQGGRRTRDSVRRRRRLGHAREPGRRNRAACGAPRRFLAIHRRARHRPRRPDG